MHKDAIASVGEEERNRFIHVCCLWSLRISNEEVEFLADMIESGWRLTTSIDSLARSKGEYWLYGTTIVNATLHPLR